MDTEDLRCLPGHPEQKPFVERFNRTFQHRDLVKNPFFVGHNVAERQSLRASSHRNCAGIELAMSVDDFQRWCDLWWLEYEQRPHGRAGIGLEGKSPLEVLAAAVNSGWIPHQIQNPRELDFLMMAAPGKEGTRQVGRQGISVCGRLYVAAELASWIGKTVYVCFDPQQPSNIYVYGSDRLTEFVCQAVWREAADVDLADIANRARHLYEILLRSVNQIRKRGKTLLRKLASDPYLLVGKTAQVELYLRVKIMRYKIVTTKNIISLSSGFQESQKREPGIPRMGLIYAPTGFGKSTAAAWLVNRERGIYVRAVSLWSPTTMLMAILAELSIPPPRFPAQMLQIIVEQMKLSQRPLFIDEADYLFHNPRMIDAARDIHDLAELPVWLIGSNNLEKLIARRKIVAGRISQ